MLSLWSRSGETHSIISAFPAERTGLLTPLLTSFALLAFSVLLEQFNLSPTPILIFAILDKNFLSPILLPSSIRTKIFQVQFQFHKKFPKTIPNFDLAAKSFQSRKKIVIPIFFLTEKNSLFFAYPFQTLASGV